MRLLVLSALIGLVGTVQAQDVPTAFKTGFVESGSILRNSITNLHVQGDSLWIGPFLNVTPNEGGTWLVAEADSLRGSRNRIFSIDIEGDVIWAGLGFTSTTDGNSVAAAGGFLVSTDGGQTFNYRFPQLDAPGETQIEYGINTLNALDVIVPEQSPPYDIDYDPVTGTVWVAGWASGIRKSSDGGLSWERVVLPTDNLDAVSPDQQYDFTVEPQRGGMGWLNHMGFAILVDELGTIWAGTPDGINRSTDGGQAWRKFKFDGTPNGLTGSWVIAVEEEPVEGRNPIWMATWNAGEAGENGRFGVTVTRDGGQTFDQVLIGVRAYDFAFDADGTVYVAAEQGLYISRDDGRSWTSVTNFNSPTSERVLPSRVEVFSVAVTDEAVWAGTSDGLVRSTNGGRTWRAFRVEVPLSPDEPSDAIPETETFAYPNPFSPAANGFTRLRYELERSSSVRIRVFDFGMNLVRTLPSETRAEGVHETLWDGTSDQGTRLPNATYFYQISTDAGTSWGKILLIE
ncbi:MAG: FlgD immunoglobulin-like domain containing protein [Bacteroidota bacterium]